jgi:hypothetical protein
MVILAGYWHPGDIHARYREHGRFANMRILIATPLYPPEVADAAAYAKELATKLSKEHEVRVVAYAHLPEEVSGVRMIAIDKHAPRLSRLMKFRRAFALAARDADAVLAINGASVELPVLFNRPSAPLVFCVADKAAHARGGFLERLAFSRARAVIQNIPPRRPEILPLDPEPTEALAAYETSWNAHLSSLLKHFNHATH